MHPFRRRNGEQLRGAGRAPRRNSARRTWPEDSFADRGSRPASGRRAIAQHRVDDRPPHVAQNTKRNGGSAIDARTTRHPGYEVSQRKRKRIEQCFGWGKTVGPLAQVMVRGLDKVDQLLTLTMAAYNLTRLRGLAELRPQVAQ